MSHVQPVAASPAVGTATLPQCEVGGPLCDNRLMRRYQFSSRHLRKEPAFWCCMSCRLFTLRGLRTKECA